MKINPSIFRAYDIRGVYPKDLNEEITQKIVLAYLDLFPYVKTLVVGRDPRKSSESLANKIIGIVLRSGRDVIDLGIAPDPLFYFALFHRQLDGGFMVSGSHNPPEYNGLTLSIKSSKDKVIKDVIEDNLEEIKKRVLAGRVVDRDPDSVKKPGNATKLDLSEEYLDYVVPRIKLERPLRIILDPSNGAVGFLAEKAFKRLGCQVKTIFGEFDGSFPHHFPDPYLAENRETAGKEVVDKMADCGFVYDGDGDRVAPLDNKGQMVSGDDCLLILAKEALLKKRGPIVHDMRVSQAFLNEMKRQGVKTYFSVSHHNAVIDKILEKKAVFGGEVTLHFLFPLDYYLVDDAVFASLKLAEVFSKEKNVADFINNLPHYFISPEIFIDSTDETKFKIIANLQAYLKNHHYDFVAVDGARINFPHGWALIRAANTTPFLKGRFEGETKDDLIEIEKEALAVFEKAGVPVTKKIYRELGLDKN